jgi:hypothetical protein
MLSNLRVHRLTKLSMHGAGLGEVKWVKRNVPSEPGEVKSEKWGVTPSLFRRPAFYSAATDELVRPGLLPIRGGAELNDEQ